MRKRLTTALLGSALTLAACGSVTAGSPPGVTPPPDPPPTHQDPIAWECHGAQFIAWDADDDRLITKTNDQPRDPWNPGPADISFRAIDPLSGTSAWEITEKDVPGTALQYDYYPWPSIPRHGTGARVGSYAITAGGAPGPSSHPQRTEFFVFDHLALNIVTGELTDHWVVKEANPDSGPTDGPVELALPCTPIPYGDLAICWRSTTDSRHQLTVFDEELTVAATHDTSVVSPGVLDLGGYYYLGADFDYDVGMGSQGTPEDFTITFLRADDLSVHTVSLPGRWYPNPTEIDWGEFEGELQIIPLQDGILWNNGEDPEWLVVSPETGAGKILTAPDNVTVQEVELGGTLATAEDFIEGWTAWEANGFAPHDDSDADHLVVFPTPEPTLVEVSADEVAWSSLGDPESDVTGSVSRTYFPDSYRGEYPPIEVGPHARWLSTTTHVFDMRGGEMLNELTGTNFLEHVDGLDIFSSTTAGFNESFGAMGDIIAVHNPDQP